MADIDLSPGLQVRLRVMRIIHAALVMGCLSFAAIAVFLRTQQPFQVPQQPVLSLAGLAFGVIALLAIPVVANMLAANWRQKIALGIDPLSTSRPPESVLEEGGPVSPHRPEEHPERSVQWWALYQTRMIILAALLEGSTFFQLIAYLTEGEKSNLVLAGILVLGLLLLFPTRNRIERWIRTQEELVDQKKGQLL
jgi:hypothetical protein